MPTDGKRTSFFPKADAAILQSKYDPPSVRPKVVGPVFDVDHANQPLQPWNQELTEAVYPLNHDESDEAPMPSKPDSQFQCPAVGDTYLYPVLTQNERLRLTMLWYYTRGSLEDVELQSRLQEKAHLASETIGWEFVVIGLLDHNTYTRLVTVGVPLAVLPRRETMCAHTINQPHDTPFMLPDMSKDWRFQNAPHVAEGGLRSYAGVPLRLETEFGHSVTLGSLCVTANSVQKPLTRSQQRSLVRLADWVVADLVHSARARRQQERRRMLELIGSVKLLENDDGFRFEGDVLDIVKTIYPQATINIQASARHQIVLEGRDPISVNELENGLWEDCEYFDYIIEKYNHRDIQLRRVVRVIAAEGGVAPLPTYLVVASKDPRLVFDDVDTWFVQTCASMLSQMWQSRLLKEAVKAKESFLRGITHQLRTPIHGILGSVELLAEEMRSRNFWSDYIVASSLPASATEPFSKDLSTKTHPLTYLDTIKASGRELISTINSMLKLNRWTEIAQAGRVDTLRRFTELESILIHELMQTMSDEVLTRSSLIFNYILPSNCDSLTIDMCLMKDCILALVINALQATPPKGVVSVTVSVPADHSVFTVDVRDTGMGIHPDDHSRIFDAYEKVDMHTTGAGLGLTLGSKLASLLNGSISLVSSAPQQGSHFRATFYNPVCVRQTPKSSEPKFTALPSTFHCLEACSNPRSLSSHFADCLITQGLTSSDDKENSLLIIEHSEEDPEHLDTLVSRVPPSQVAICLVPSTRSNIHLNTDHQEQVQFRNNIIYSTSPFTYSTLKAALQRADTILSDIKLTASQPPAAATHDNPLKDIPLRITPPVTLPKNPPPRLLRQKTASPPTATTTTTTSATDRITALLVDDNPTNLRIMQMYCKKRQIPYLCATDGHQAVSIFKTHLLPASTSPPSPSKETPTPTPTPTPTAINLILMDLQMPVLDGISATRAIRDLELQHKGPSTPENNRSVLFIITGQDSKDDRKGAEDAGADAFFVKPVGPRELDRGIGDWFPGWSGGS
ncbi:histidine kinase HHK3 [Aaosphaeria arxii CBS 175.79]|uniref:histidine kinase n=1 Tax=Aaosphaeria arxii CBS 175.79 TaxID=1450172 RepID=A0A6A5XE07_9PLEO|nr:histidine kinase HHK3 [Aaosphaeria arxii CBS 175.79]KAF2011262.1 histidine kinase HHK3 [Aaosphaeria arxii CBS 175.79]